MSTPDLQQTIDAVWRMEAAKIVATLTRAVGDVGLAEDVIGSGQASAKLEEFVAFTQMLQSTGGA